jgi:hypothetical protein
MTIMRKTMPILCAVFMALLLTACTMLPARAKGDNYFYKIPKGMIFDADDEGCVYSQRKAFDDAMHDIVANEYVKALDSFQHLVQNDDCYPSAGALRLLRNAAYARHGKSFISKDLQKYFYTTCKTVFKKNPKYADSMLTKMDKKNIAFIKKLEKDVWNK